MNAGVGKEFYRKGNSVKRFRPDSESPDSKNCNFLRSSPSQILGSAFGRTDFSRIFIFGPPEFFADFVAGFSLLIIFVGKSAQKNPPGKSPAKSSKIYTTKIPDTFLQRGRATKLTIFVSFSQFLPLPRGEISTVCRLGAL